MEKFILAKETAWKVILMSVPEAIDLIEKSGFEAKVVERSSDIPAEPFLRLDCIWLVSSNGKVISAKMG